MTAGSETGRYRRASATCAGWITAASCRSAIVRATRRTRWKPLAESVRRSTARVRRARASGVVFRIERARRPGDLPAVVRHEEDEDYGKRADSFRAAFF